MVLSRRHRILIVDDEPDNVEYLCRVFRREFEVEQAADAEEALSRIAAARFDVIITDQMMPGMTGVELLRRSLDLSPDSIRIVITGFPDLETAINSVNRGRVYRFFTKPLDREELYAAVKQALRAAELAEGKARAAVEISTGAPEEAPVSPDLDAMVAARTLSLTRELERLRDRLDRDPELGCLSGRALRERIEEEAARADRFGLPLSLLCVRVPPVPPRADATPTGSRANHNPFLAPLRMVLDVALRDSRKFDCVGRVAEDTLVVLLPHTDAAGAAVRGERVMRALAATRFPAPRLAHVTRGDQHAGGLWEAALQGVGVAP